VDRRAHRHRTIWDLADADEHEYSGGADPAVLDERAALDLVTGSVGSFYPAQGRHPAEPPPKRRPLLDEPTARDLAGQLERQRAEAEASTRRATTAAAQARAEAEQAERDGRAREQRRAEQAAKALRAVVVYIAEQAVTAAEAGPLEVEPFRATITRRTHPEKPLMPKPTPKKQPAPAPPTINIAAFRAAVATGGDVKITAAQLALLLDAYEAEHPPPSVLGVAGNAALVRLPVIVPSKDAERLRRHRGPLFCYGAAEISAATEVPPQIVRKAIQQGIIRPGELYDVISLAGRLAGAENSSAGR